MKKTKSKQTHIHRTSEYSRLGTLPSDCLNSRASYLLCPMCVQYSWLLCSLSPTDRVLCYTTGFAKSVGVCPWLTRARGSSERYSPLAWSHPWRTSPVAVSLFLKPHFLQFPRDPFSWMLSSRSENSKLLPLGSRASVAVHFRLCWSHAL